MKMPSKSLGMEVRGLIWTTNISHSFLMKLDTEPKIISVIHDRQTHSNFKYLILVKS